MKEDSTVANGRTFLVTDHDGRPSRPYDGFYHRDVRHLSEYSLEMTRSLETLGLHHSRPGQRVIHAAPAIADGERELHVRRRQCVTESLVERIEVTNLTRDPIEETLSIEVGTGFDDLFEVRGYSGAPDREINTEVDDGGVLFRYEASDVDFERSTTVVGAPADRFSTAVTTRGATLSVGLELAPRETTTVTFAVRPDREVSNPVIAFERTNSELRGRFRRWYDRTSLPTTGDREEEAVLERSRLDLLSLTMETDYGPVFTAGTPWFATAFGRDAIIAAYQALPMTTAPAVATLRYLADHQATDVNEFQAAAPGKILHEIRSGELAARGEVPHTPYYGTIDATALFVVLLHETWVRTRDDELLADLWSNLERALAWLEEYGDEDGDGFLEYPTEGHEGLTHRAWKDSNDGIVNPDGSHPAGPLAVVEVQGYYYDALSRSAALYRVRGEDRRAAELETHAAELAERFDECFWLPERSYYAVALDGDGEPIESVTTNPGHCLWSGIVPSRRADAIVDRLIADDMFSGWGIRTLSSDHAAYNPQSYHRGSVWPHDNSLVVLGMLSYDRRDAARTVTDALIEAAAARGPPRLPELFAGFERARSAAPVEYGAACEPQAWAAGTPVACLGGLEGRYELDSFDEAAPSC